MRRLIVVAGSALLLSAGMVRAQDMSLGGTMAATAGAATLGAAGGANFSAAINKAQNTPRGSNTTGGGTGGGSSRNGGASTTGAPAVPAAASGNQPILYNNESGESLLNDLARGRSGVRSGSHSTRRVRIRTTRTRRVSRTRRGRNAQLRKYQLPARGYLAYYLPDDRYKVSSGDWKYVALEDDARNYPSRYYYAPTAPNFLQLLPQPALGARIKGTRSSRVLGFHTWQDAMSAGYRPDPVSKPAPGAQLVHLVSIARGPELAHYAGFVYAGQVTPEDFEATYRYVLTVERLAMPRADTRALLGPTVGQVLLAALGEAPAPTQIGQNTTTTTSTTTTTPTSTTTTTNSTTTTNDVGGDQRTGQFNNFSARAGAMSSTRR